MIIIIERKIAQCCEDVAAFQGGLHDGVINGIYYKQALQPGPHERRLEGLPQNVSCL